MARAKPKQASKKNPTPGTKQKRKVGTSPITSPKDVRPKLTMLHALLDSIPDIVFFKDLDGTYLGCNLPFTEFVGRPKEAIIGKTDHDLFDKEIADFFREHDRKMLEKKTPRHNEEWITYPDSRRRFVDTLKTPYWGPHGELVGILGVSRDITERNNAEEMLRLRESYLSSIIENQPGLVWMKDRESRFLAVNQAFARSCSLGSPDKVVGKTDLDVWPRELAEAYRADDLRVMSGEKPIATEERIFDAGVYKWFETFKTPVFAADNSVIGTTGFSHDITERKQAEDALRKSRENLRGLFEAIGDMVIVATRDGRILFTNSAVTRVLGYSAEELAGMRVLELHPPGMRVEAEEIYGAMFEGTQQSCPLPLAAKNDVLVPVETRVWPGEWDGIACIYGMSKDLTAEQEALQKFDRLFRSNPMPMALSSIEERRFLDINEAFMEKLGFLREDVIGKTTDELRLFPQPEQQAQVARDLADHGRVRNVSLKIGTKSGNLLDGVFFGELVQSQGKDYFLTVMIDVTDRVNLEKMRDDLVHMIVHDLKNPLSAIMLAASNLTTFIPSDGPSEINRLIDVILGNTKKLNGLIMDVLLVRTMESDQMIVTTGNVSGRQLKAELNWITTAAGSETRILHIDVPDDLSLVTDKGLLVRVLENLLSNGIKHTPPGGTVTLKVSPQDDRFLFEVIDSGEGIPAEYLDRIFDKFFKITGQQMTSPIDTGLGLTFCKMAVDALGGSIGVESEIGKGSRFLFSIPAQLRGRPG